MGAAARWGTDSGYADAQPRHHAHQPQLQFGIIRIRVAAAPCHASNCLKPHQAPPHFWTALKESMKTNDRVSTPMKGRIVPTDRFISAPPIWKFETPTNLGHFILKFHTSSTHHHTPLSRLTPPKVTRCGAAQQRAVMLWCKAMPWSDNT